MMPIASKVDERKSKISRYGLDGTVCDQFEMNLSGANKFYTRLSVARDVPSDTSDVFRLSK